MDLVGFRHDGVRIDNSPGKGRGIFATKPFKKGDLVELAPALLIPDEDGDVLFITVLDQYLFGMDEGKGATVLGMGFASFYNHSDKPNAEFVVGEKAIVFKAIKPIKEGQEITVDYGWPKDFKKKMRLK